MKPEPLHEQTNEETLPAQEGPPAGSAETVDAERVDTGENWKSLGDIVAAMLDGTAEPKPAKPRVRWL